MDVAITRTLEACVLPPGGPLILCLLGLALLRRRPRMARVLLVTGIAVLWLASLPVVGHGLLHSLERHPALSAAAARAARADAIVVLGAGRYSDAPEYGGDTASRFGLERLRYGAHLHRLTALPVIVTGGSPTGERIPEARFMAQVLEQEWGVTQVWREERSRTTRENAEFTAAMLRERGLGRVLLVTQAWHMPRAAESFKRVGIEVIAAPTGFAEAAPFPRNGLPDTQSGLLQTRLALHEWLGSVVYALQQR